MYICKLVPSVYTLLLQWIWEEFTIVRNSIVTRRKIFLAVIYNCFPCKDSVAFCRFERAPHIKVAIHSGRYAPRGTHLSKTLSLFYSF